MNCVISEAIISELNAANYSPIKSLDIECALQIHNLALANCTWEELFSLWVGAYEGDLDTLKDIFTEIYQDSLEDHVIDYDYGKDMERELPFCHPWDYQGIDMEIMIPEEYALKIKDTATQYFKDVI